MASIRQNPGEDNKTNRSEEKGGDVYKGDPLLSTLLFYSIAAEFLLATAFSLFPFRILVTTSFPHRIN